MNTIEIRERLIKFLNTEEVKQNKVSECCGISRYKLSRFKNGQNLKAISLNELDTFLKNRGY